MSETNNNYNNCYKCELHFVQLDIPVECNGCNALIHNKCLEFRANELKC